MTPRAKKRIRIALGLLVVVVALGWSLKGVKAAEVWTALAEVDAAGAGIVLLLSCVNMVLHALEWRLVLSSVHRVTFTQVLSSYLVGLFANVFLPFKMGDVAQGLVLAQKTGMGKTTSLSTVFMQRLFGGLSLVLVMSFTATAYSLPREYGQALVILGVVLASVAATLAFMLPRAPAVISAMVRGGSRPRSRLLRRMLTLMNQALQGAGILRSGKTVAATLLVGVTAWVTQVFMIDSLLVSMGRPVGLIGASVTLLVINLALLIPIAPGNIGTYQVVCILVLGWFGVPKAVALTFSLLFQVLQLIPVLAGGGTLLLHHLHGHSSDHAPPASTSTAARRQAIGLGPA
jgi:glycosyltransferase 2 family protein